MCKRPSNFNILFILFMALSLKIATLLKELPTALESPLPIVPLCLLKCKDNHMLQMENEWSSDFVFPLNDLLRSGATSEQMNKRVNELCRHNSELASCLLGCPFSVENEIMQLGLRPWQAICENIRDMQTQFGCWKTNIDAITLECSLESQKLRNAIESFTRNVSVQMVESICIDLSQLSHCFVSQYGKHCGNTSKKLIDTLFSNSRDVIVKMLRMKWNDGVPSKCASNAVAQTNGEFLALTNATSAAFSKYSLRHAHHHSTIVEHLVILLLLIANRRVQ